MIKRIAEYLNPISRLGVKQYSTLFPFIFMLVMVVLSEVFAYEIAKDPMIVRIYVIFLFLAFIIYFSFRDGIRGGFISTIITTWYYFYIIYTRNYEGKQLVTAVETTFILASLYFFLSAIIGGLKQTIDTFIEREAEARHIAEEGKIRMKTILKQLPVGVLIADKDGGKLMGNRHMETLLGRKTAKQLMLDEDYISSYVHHAEKQIAAKEWPILRAFKKGEVIIAEEMEYIREDKKRLFLRVNAAPIRNKHHQIIAAVSTFYDITQEKELEQRKDDFVNMASHELKTPLTSMKLYIDLVLRQVQQYDDEKVEKMLVNIKNQTKKLQDLVNDLLDVSRIQTGKLHFNKEDFEINGLIEETIEMLQEATNHQKIVFIKRGSLVVHGDRFRIYQILTNLLTNAIKYSPEGKKIVIDIKREGAKAVVSVQDFGIGISKEQKKKIFERLYQVSDPKEKTFPGLGMGLYISKEIIKRHRGAIWVESQKGKGSTFFFSLPLKF